MPPPVLLERFRWTVRTDGNAESTTRRVASVLVWHTSQEYLLAPLRTSTLSQKRENVWHAKGVRQRQYRAPAKGWWARRQAAVALVPRRPMGPGSRQAAAERRVAVRASQPCRDYGTYLGERPSPFGVDGQGEVTERLPAVRGRLAFAARGGVRQSTAKEALDGVLRRRI